MRRLALFRIAILTVAIAIVAPGCRRASRPSDAKTPEKTFDPPAFALKDENLTRASQEHPRILRGDVFEDYDYAFTLRRPSAKWQFLDDRMGRKVNPEAALVMTNISHAGFVAVIADEFGRGSLEEYFDLAQSGIGVTDVKELARRREKVDGRDALIIKNEASVNGVRSTYRYQIIEDRGFYYQVVGWALTAKFAGVEREIERISRSLKFADDRKPKTRAIADVDDDSDVDWRIADNVYSNATFGFRLRPRDKLRLMSRQELEGMGSDSPAGIIGVDSAFVQSYFPEVVGEGGQIQKDFSAARLLSLEEVLNVAGIDPKTSLVKIGGIEAQQRIYENVKYDEGEFDVAIAFFFHDSDYFLIHTTWPLAERAGGRARLQKSHELLEWFGTAERRKLGVELRKDDANNAVGAKYPLRRGVYWDFQYGYTLKLPQAVYRAKTGGALQDEYPDARLLASLLREGIEIVVTPELIDQDHSEYHQLLLEGLERPKGTPTDSQRHGDLNLLLSAFDRTVEGFTYSYRLVTAVRGRKHVQILASALKSNERFLDKRLPEIIRGFDLPRQSPQVTERKARTIKDHRLGFRLNYPRGWTARETPFRGLEAVASLFILSKSNVACSAGEICTPGEFQEDLALEGMMRNARVDVDVTTRSESPSTLAGIPSRRVYFEGRRRGIDVFSPPGLPGVATPRTSLSSTANGDLPNRPIRIDGSFRCSIEIYSRWAT